MSELNGKPIGTFPGDTVADTATMSRGKAYAIAFALVAAAATVRYLLGLFDEGVLLFAIFFPGIMLTALWCGTGPAVFATILSLVVVWYAFIPPAFEFQLKARATWLNLGLFCGSSALIVWIGARHRKLLAAIEQSEKIRKLLVEELHHRSKNSMSVASTIISRTLSNQPDTASQLIARLGIVLLPDEVYTEPEAIECLLHRVLLAQLKPYGTDRFALTGAQLKVSPRQARNLALVAHELATNSAKYGGLSVENGFLFISWRLADRVVIIDWKENGRSHAVASDRTPGFGTRLIETMIRDLKGNFERMNIETGYACRINFPVELPEYDHSGGTSQRVSPT